MHIHEYLKELERYTRLSCKRRNSLDDDTCAQCKACPVGKFIHYQRTVELEHDKGRTDG